MQKIGGCAAWSIKFSLLPTRIQMTMATVISVDCDSVWIIFNRSVSFEMHRISLVDVVLLDVKAIWLTPIQPTKWKDYGYDISNFCDVDPRFGTLDDFRQLVDDVHSRNMRLIIDFVPNHTSIEHPWFQAALRNDPQYVDYFIWHEGKNQGQDRPTNWVGASGQHMWTFAPERNMYYLHQFLDCQPDLNYRNSRVLEEMDNVLRFWLEMGVDGFRVDAPRHLLENNRFRDEGLSKEAKGADPEVDYDAYLHTETADQPGSYELIRHWRQLLDDYSRENNRDYLVLLAEVREREERMSSLASSRHRLTTVMWRRWWIFTLPVERNAVQIWRSISTSPIISIRKERKSMVSNWISNCPNGKTIF